MKKVLIVGAGFSGATVARLLAETGIKVEVVDSRSHLAGNCHTDRDEATGVMVHRYGPHIFHTDDDEVWDFVNAYGTFQPYVNRVKAQTGGQVYTLPINLLTINQFYGKTFRPAEALEFIKSQQEKLDHEPQSFEEQALTLVGSKMYEAFFKGYTAKQWGRSPTELPAAILKRLPLRFNYDDNYFSHKHQGMPLNGYTEIVENILNHENITVRLNTSFSRGQADGFDHVFYSGAVDEYFDFACGELKYRTLDFEYFWDEGDYQGCAVMNYCEGSVPYTRITEHKYFAPWEKHDRTICFKEYPREAKREDVKYYPVPDLGDDKRLAEYKAMTAAEANVTFLGRLGTYRYMDMDVTIREALDAARKYLAGN